jgi:hypothetical protein
MLAVVGASSASQAATTVSPTEPPSTPGGLPVVRGESVDVSVDMSARSYWRSNASGAFAVQNLFGLALGRGCLGDNPAPGGTNNSPRTTLTVTDPNGDVVYSGLSPARNLTDLISPPLHEPAANQAPANNNYRGDFDGSNVYHGMKTTLDMTGRPSGVYTVTTSHQNMVKTGTGSSAVCTIGTPSGTTVTPGPSVETEHFEYRPWQVNFKDALGKGKVSANVVPREFTFSIGEKSSPIFQGTPQTQSFYSFGGHFLLPNDPAACAELITNCLPNGAVACEPSAGCVPRIMVINQRFKGTPHGMIGFFDLATKAFIASAAVDGTSRVLFSLGTENDALYHSMLQKLSDNLAASGIDLASILATEVVVANPKKQLSLSLLNGLQIDPTGPEGKGIRIYTPGTVQAGVILDVYSSLRLDGGACVTNTASSADGPTRYTRNEDNGYTVNKTDLLPEVPSVGPLGAIVGGPVYSIQGKFTTAGSASQLANVSTAVIGVDTAADEPNGYPVWISPFVSGVHTGAPKTMDFLGTATWQASETPLLGGCLVVDFMVGTGVAIYDSPLPVGLHSLIDLVGAPSPQLEALQATVDTAVQQVLDTVTTNPVVESLLGQLVGSLPLSDLPVPIP